MGSNQNLKAYVRYDGSGRVVAGSLIFRRKKPKVGRWHEIAISECCEYPTTTTTSTSTSTSTSTTTTTTTAGPSFYLYRTEVNSTGESRATACSEFGGPNDVNLYSSEANPANVTILYTDSALTTPYVGNNGIYAFGNYQLGIYSANIDANGVVTNKIAC
jgi:hypothetical protein